MPNKEINQAREFLYHLMALFFVEDYAKNNANEIVQNLKVLCENSFDEDVSIAANKILDHITLNGVESIYDEYQELFLVPFGNYVNLSSSWYHEQREGGAMQILVKEVLAKTKIRKNEGSFLAPEDHYGFIFTLCSYLLKGQINGDIKEDLQKELFAKVINPYINNLYGSMIESNMPIYSQVGVILANLCNFDRAFLELQR